MMYCDFCGGELGFREEEDQKRNELEYFVHYKITSPKLGLVIDQPMKGVMCVNCCHAIAVWVRYRNERRKSEKQHEQQDLSKQ